VRGRSVWSDGGSDTWDIEIPAFDKASLYQTIANINLSKVAVIPTKSGRFGG